MRSCELSWESQVPVAVNTFRVFVSSTFGDLAEERAALHERVFPRLRALCSEADAEFQAIDLRWGVSEEAAIEQRVAEICLGEIDRCRQITRRPNFLVLLGQRYGARPAPPRIDAAMFRRLCARLTAEQGRLVNRWYVEDRNHVPAVFVLQPRRGGYRDDALWRPTERALSEALTAAALQEPAEREAVALLRTSITEQEILRGIPENGPEHGAAFAFQRTILGLPEDASAAPYRDFLDERPDTEAAAAQQLLRDRLSAMGAARLRLTDYRAAWDYELGRPTTGHIDRLCEDVYASLAEVIRDELQAAETDEHHYEEQAHEEFAAERRAHFIGRQDTIARIRSYLGTDDRRPLLLIGESGGGKTSLLAEVAHRLRVETGGRPVLARFIGATPRSADLRSFLDDLRRSLKRLGRPGSSQAERPYSLAEAVREPLAALPSEPGLVVVLDALDQLSGDVDLSWLPDELPSGVRMVLSAQEGSAAATAALAAGSRLLRLPALRRAEGCRILRQLLQEEGRSLLPAQRAEVLQAFAERGNPLHLRLAFEEARRWASYTSVEPGSVPLDVPGMTGRLLERLEKEHGTVLVCRALGLLAVSRNGLSEPELLDLLSADPLVLEEVESHMPRSPKPRGLLPPVLWARLRTDLEPYLNVRRNEGRLLLGFYHRQLTEAVTSRYLTKEETTALHRRLADYFGAQPLDTPGGPRSAVNARKAAELPYHQTLCGSWDELWATLTDFGFLERKVKAVGVSTELDAQGREVRRHAGVHALQDDYELALRLWPQAGRDGERGLANVPQDRTGTPAMAGQRGIMAQFARALRLEAHNLAADPELTWQQLANRLQWESGAARLVRAEARRRGDGSSVPTLRSRTRPHESESLTRRLREAGDKCRLVSCAFVPRSGLLAIAGEDRTVRLWDVGTGRRVRVLSDMPAVPQSCAATPDGKYVIATTVNPAGTVHVWEVRTGRQVAWRTAHEPSCTACAVLPDGSAVLTFGTDGRIRRWTLPELAVDGELPPAPEPLTCGTVSPDGQTVAYGGREGVVYMRSVDRTGPVTEMVYGQGDPLTAVALGPEGRSLVAVGMAGAYGLEGRIVSWDLSARSPATVRQLPSSAEHCVLSTKGSLLVTSTDDGRVQLWEPPRMRHLATLNAHTTTAVACALSPDAEALASVSADGMACIWDVMAARGSNPGGHDGLVQQCSFTREGEWLVTASVDGTVRRWDATTGQEIGSPVSHPGSTVLMLHQDARPGDEQITLVAGNTGTVLRTALPPVSDEPAPAPAVVGEHGAEVWGLAPLPDGTVVTGGLDGACKVWDVRRFVMVREVMWDRSPVRTCATSVGGGFVASGGDSGLLYLWDPLSGALITDPQQHPAAITAITCGVANIVVVGDADGHVELTGPRTGWTRRALGHHPGSPVTSVLWSNPGFVVSCGADGSLAHLPIDGDASSWRRRVHRGPVYALGVTPSGSVIVSGGADGLLVLWERTTGRILARLPIAGRVHAIAVHPHEPVVACVGDGGLVIVTEVAEWSGRW
ncbi:hypothetical protein ADL04_27545 [Streptomyces sp. NRRL B-3648]|nr:hypothetical protein ADL04_27545 [Streptomyces sp. NRRL B-3648]